MGGGGYACDHPDQPGAGAHQMSVCVAKLAVEVVMAVAAASLVSKVLRRAAA